MALEDDIAVLAGAPLFELLERDALRLLAFAADTQSLAAGEILFSRGDRSDGAYIVREGRIGLDMGEIGSQPHIAEAGALIGRMALFVRTERPATAIAIAPSKVIRISPSLMRRCLEEFPTGAVAVHDVLANDLHQLAGGLEHVRRTFLSSDERI